MSPEIIKKRYTTTQAIMAQIAGVLFIIPLAPFICRLIPPVFIAGWNIDLIIAIIISIIIVRLMLWLIKPIIIPLLLLISAVLVYNQFHNRYTFKNIASGYKALVNQNWAGREK